MRVCESIRIAAPAPSVWAFIDDHERYLHFMHGMTRWEVEGERSTGLGARIRMLMRVGSAEIGGLVEVVEYDENSDFAWNSVTGIDQRGRWRLREHALGHTIVELRISYGVAGSGILGWLSERLAAPTVRDHLRRSLQQLKRQVEHEELRRAAAARRQAREQGAGTN